MKIEFEKLDGQDRYFWMIASVVPRPIAFVSTVSPDGIANLAPFSFFNGVSSNPPVVSISIGEKRGGIPKDTLANVLATKELVVNLVPESIGRQMVDCSANFPAEVSEFQETGLTPVASDIVAPPRVKESPLSMECKLYKTVEVGKTTMVLAEVLCLHVADEMLTDGLPDADKMKPLGRLGGELYSPHRETLKITRP